MKFESKIALIAKRYNLSYKWTALRFGYRRVEIECEDFDEAYAVSTLCESLREQADRHGEEVLSYRHDAWVRLLSLFLSLARCAVQAAGT